MSWKTWTKISGVILFVIAILGFYYGNFYKEGPSLSIQNFPSLTDLDSLDYTKDISFSFFLYNAGGQTTFVKSVIILEYDDQAKQITTPITIDPSRDFAIAPGETKEIKVTLPAANKDFSGTITAEIFYDSQKLVSQTIPLSWGGIL